MQKEIVEAHPNENLAVYVVWLPMIQTDSERAARRSATMYRDPRIWQFYDPDRLTGIAFTKELKLDQLRELMDSLAGDDPLKQRIEAWFSMSPEERPVWDVVYFFPAGVEWTDSLPRPTTWTKQMAFFGDPTGDEPSGLFFRHESKQPPGESDWFVEIRRAMMKLVPGSRDESSGGR